MLSLKKGKNNLAIIRGGEKDGKIISIQKNEDLLKNSILLKKGKIEIIPNSTREIIYICGPSGCGKSSFCATYIKNFKKMFPESDIFVLSRLKEDKILDKMEINRIVMDETIISEPIDIHESMNSGSLVVFDDCDSITNENIRKEVGKIQNDILETGRHNNIYCLITSHLLFKSKRNEMNPILNELHRLVIFPKYGNKQNMKKILIDQFDFERNKVSKVLALNSRWIVFGKGFPSYFMWEAGVILT